MKNNQAADLALKLLELVDQTIIMLDYAYPDDRAKNERIRNAFYLGITALGLRDIKEED